MRGLMNHYLMKISRTGLLMAPPDDTNMSGSGGGGDSQNNNQNNQNNQNQNNAGGDDNDDSGDDDDDSDGIGSDIFDQEDDIQLDDENSDDSLTQEEQERGQQMGAKIKQQVEQFAFSESDVPDIDWNDKKQIAGFMSTVGQKAIFAAIGQIAPVINHAMSIMTPRMEKKIQSAIKGGSVRNAASQAFDELGIADKDRAFAKSIFNRALGKMKNDPKKAAASTRKALQGLGISMSGSSGGGGKNGGGRSGDGPASRSGKQALDFMFGE